MKQRKTIFTALILCLLLALTLNSCDNAIEPIATKKAYSIYGIFELKAKTNYIRIKNLTVPLVKNSKHSLNATVHLKNLKTGHSQLLTKDSLVIFGYGGVEYSGVGFGGVVIHIFKITMPIHPLTTYKVIVKRNSDGRETTAQVTTPSRVSMKISPRVALCGTRRTVTFGNISTGETLIAYAVALKKPKHKGPPKPGGPNKPPKKFIVKKQTIQFPGKLGDKRFKRKIHIQFPCKLKSPQIQLYSATYGPRYDKNEPVIPDSVTNINRFIKSKLVAVVKNEITFVADTSEQIDSNYEGD